MIEKKENKLIDDLLNGSESEIDYFEEIKKIRSNLRAEAESKVPTDPIGILSVQIKQLMDKCHIWVDKYRGFTDIDLRTKIY